MCRNHAFQTGIQGWEKEKIFDNLLNQNFTVDCKNKVWCTDFTYMRQPNGKFRYNGSDQYSD